LDDLTLLVILPIAIAALNLLRAVRIAARPTTLAGKLGRVLLLFVLTAGFWAVALVPYAIGMADSAPSCSRQVGYPGCRKFEELSALLPKTLGNFGYLWLLLLLDVLIVMIPWYVARRKGQRVSLS
jgi:hypothetical protein